MEEALDAPLPLLLVAWSLGLARLDGRVVVLSPLARVACPHFPVLSLDTMQGCPS